jgi:hypothetical protein
MLIGLIGAPNKGKSTIFSALTSVKADIADYPFTTINPNLGVAYASKPCPERELGVKCQPRNSLCSNGIRLIPVNVLDVAGLVPDAHMGKGMGNQFLNDLSAADALIQVVDISGTTDLEGRPCSGFDPSDEVKAVMDELIEWMSGIIARHMPTVSKRTDGAKALSEILTGFHATQETVSKAAEENFLTTSSISWSAESIRRFATSLLRITKPLIVAANKLDKSDNTALEKLRKALPGVRVVGTSGAIELALRRASDSGIIRYTGGSGSFELLGNPDQQQNAALDYMSSYLGKNGGTGVQTLLNTTVFELLHKIVAYPVEDENKYTDHFGNVLPDAMLLTDGSTALDLAASIHTDLARGMLYAIDARKKLRLAKDYKLKDNDVIKVVSVSKGRA